MKSKHAFVLVTVFWSSLIGYVQAESRNEKATLPDTAVLPFLPFVPDGNRVGDLSDRLNKSGNNTAATFPYAIPLSTMSTDRSLAIEKAADTDRDSKPIIVTLDKKEGTFPAEFLLFAVGLGALAVLIWWRRQKSEKQKKSIRRLVREIEHEWARYGS